MFEGVGGGSEPTLFGLSFLLSKTLFFHKCSHMKVGQITLVEVSLVKMFGLWRLFVYTEHDFHLILGFNLSTPQVSTHVALDHQTYCALAQHTQITWTPQLKCERAFQGGVVEFGLTFIINPTYMHG